jgi:endonuclease/exonuclease/phosphatase family metal-dependent hydrolase
MRTLRLFFQINIRKMKIKRLIKVLLMALLIIPGTIFSVDGQSKKDTPFIIISYNIRMNTPGDGVNAWPLRKDKVAGLFKFHQADIFNVQEALPEQMDDLVSMFPEFDHVGVGRDDGKRAGEHMGVFYKKARFEKVTDGMFWLNEATDKPGFGWDAVCNRTVTWIKLKDKITKKSFYVLDTHFDHRGVKAREEAAKLILEKIKVINAENLPLILTGDLNLIKTSVPVQSILAVLPDAMDKTITPHYGPTGTSGGFDVKELPRKIDFIFINDKVTVLRHGHLSESYGLFYPSDHLPVLAEVRLN